jgi:predicted AAA+ superfamily ATPase
MCAARCGQLVNLSGLASDCGITHNTARSWLSVLETSYIVSTIQPHFRNFSKRMIKSPKLYFIDPGLAAWLLGIRNTSQLSTHPMRGALFETWVYSELLKGAYNRRTGKRLYFWRDRAGLEIDFLAEHANALVPIEVKSGKTFATDWLVPIERWLKLAGREGGRAWLVHGGDDSGMRNGIETLGWRDIERLVAALSTP